MRKAEIKRTWPLADPQDTATSRRVQEILDALEAPPIDKATRSMFCRWLYRAQKFPEIFKNDPFDVEEKIILTCRAILESDGNEGALVEPIVRAVSLCMRPHWISQGLAWVAAFDEIPLAATLQTLADLFGEKAAAEHLPNVLRRKLWQIFGPDVGSVKPAKAKAAPKPPASLTRVAGVEANVRLGLELLALRSATADNREYGRQVRKRFDIEPKLAVNALQVAALYGRKPEIFRRLSWNCLVTLSSPSLPGAARAALERRIVAGARVGAPEIRAARGANRIRRPRCQVDQPKVAIAA
jgi:hypothetical protein